jgi:RimJ/RimL family protein N-acetyltransferase
MNNNIMNLKIVEAQKTNEDCFLIMNWRNDPKTRYVSFNQEEKILETFKIEYYEKYFLNMTPPLFVTFKDIKVGVVSFIDDHKNKSHTISINLAPEWRGKKLGIPTINAGLDYLSSIKHYNTIYAHIKNINTASIKIFSKCGFKEYNKYEKFGEIFLTYALTIKN